MADKAVMIREILAAVNAQAERSKDWVKPSKRADGDLFFSLAFLSEEELLEICKEAGIILPKK